MSDKERRLTIIQLQILWRLDDLYCESTLIDLITAPVQLLSGCHSSLSWSFSETRWHSQTGLARPWPMTSPAPVFLHGDPLFTPGDNILNTSLYSRSLAACCSRAAIEGPVSH